MKKTITQILTLVAVLLMSAGNAKAEKTIFSYDFADWTTPASITSSTEVLYNGMYFKSSKEFTFENGVMTWCNNNAGANYYIKIPLIGINNGTITVTIETDINKSKVNYGLSSSSFTASNAAGTNGIVTFSISSGISSSTADLYLGRQSSSFNKVSKIIVTTDDDPVANDFVVDAPTISADDYTTGDIIFQDGGELIDIPEEGLQVTGVVKVVKIFPAKRWYTIGFPFDVESITGDFGTGETNLTPVGYSVDPTTDDFWLKALNTADVTFTQATAFEANKGYIIEVPTNLVGKEITFTSAANPQLNATPEALARHASHESGYALTVNPGVSSVIARSGEFAGHYKHTNGGQTFLLEDGTGIIREDATEGLRPFEALLVLYNAVYDGGAAMYAIGVGDGTTELNAPNVADPVIATKYYNLQGQPIGAAIYRAQTTGVYIVKQIHASGKTTVTKQIK
jgi:hypothetical protein